MEKETVHKIIDTLGSGPISKKLGVSSHSVRFARTNGKFAASWYRPLKALCDEAGIDCPLETFNWKKTTPQSEDAS